MKSKSRKIRRLYRSPKEDSLSRLILTVAAIILLFDSLFPQPVAAAEAIGILPFPVYAPQAFVNTLPIAKERPRRTIYITVTAYSSTPDQTDDTPFIAASGKHVFDGMVAANFLRFGTRVRFPEYSGGKNFFVEDRMHERFTNRMDVWMETREEAKKFGIRRLKVEIY